MIVGLLISPQQATAKQKCLAHIQRELEALSSSRFESNRQFSSQVSAVFKRARQAYRDYHAASLTLEQLQTQRLILEVELADVIDHPPKSGWAADAQALAWIIHESAKRCKEESLKRFRIRLSETLSALILP